MSLYLSPNPKVSPKLNYGLGVIMSCQCRFINHKKCTTLVKDVDNAEAVHVWGGVVWEISVSSAQFFL